MKVFTSDEIKFIEKCAVEDGAKYDELMEKAGNAVAAFAIRRNEVKAKEVIVLCGKGNNGGDGFVAARRLSQVGAKVGVVLVQGMPTTDIAELAFKKMGENINIYNWDNQQYETQTAVEKADIIIDAIYGIGFSGEMSDHIERLINIANKNTGAKIAVDLPSGCQCNTGKVHGVCFKADFTITFTSIKPANILHPSTSYCGKNIVASVGIDKTLVERFPGSFSVLKESDILPNFKKRDPLSHKGNYGKLAMICGSYGMLGAAAMSARAALRCGVGLLNIVTDEMCYPILAPLVPEAVFTIINFENGKMSQNSGNELFQLISNSTACLIGPGLGALAKIFTSPIVEHSHCPLVLDADALNFVAQDIDMLKRTQSPIIITPHPGEMARLSEKTVVQVEIDRINISKRIAKDYNVFTVLKGSGSLVCAPDGDIRMNTTGNAGMAKGGSGDVLAGMIASFLAQGMTPFNAATSGVFIHGKAGDLCAQNLSQTAMLPTDMIEVLPEIFSSIEKKLL